MTVAKTSENIRRGLYYKEKAKNEINIPSDTELDTSNKDWSKVSIQEVHEMSRDGRRDEKDKDIPAYYRRDDGKKDRYNFKTGRVEIIDL